MSTPRRRIRGLAFDLEGTVVDVEAAHHHGHLAAAKEFGLELSLAEAYAKLPHIIGGPDEKVCSDILSLLDPDTRNHRNQVTLGEILACTQAHYARLLAEMPIAPRRGFLEFYARARDLGLKLTIGSATSEEQAVTLLKRSGLMSLFGQRNIVLREHVTNLKPAPDVFLKTASIMGIDPSDQLVFEDSPRGVQAALTAGSQAVGMPVVIRALTVGALVDAGACRIFFDWGEINVSALIENLS
ncbi:MAG TPA: HAD family phosphatase [Patescibacteria group bacterium]|nr:HAD family phosphatase [Patescibacteria group bacterium]